jgi:predicted DNA-binding transcriptional regulator AlpA
MTATLIQFPPHRMRRDLEPFVSKRRVAAYLGRSERWIEQQYRHGFPHHKDGPSRLVRFRLSEVDEFMNGRRAS